MAPTGAEAVQYGTGEKSCLSQPRGLHVDVDGQLYVADFANFSVVRFGHNDDAAGRVVVGERGKQLMDVDYLKDIDKPLSLPDGEGVLLKNPIDIVLDSDGALLVLDCPMGRVQRFELGPKGSPASVVVPPPKSMPAKSLAVPEAIKHPRCMLHHPDGSLVICDTWSHRVLKYGKDSLTPELLAGKPNSCGCTDLHLSFPSTVAFLEDGSCLVSDTNNHRIQRFRPVELKGETVAGSCEGKAGSSLMELSMPTGLVVEADGSFLVADRGNARVLRFREGQGELVLGPDLVERPWGLAVDHHGSIFVSDEKRGVVLKLPESGVATGVKPAKPIGSKTPAVKAVEAPQRTAPTAPVAERNAPIFQPPERAKVEKPMGNRAQGQPVPSPQGPQGPQAETEAAAAPLRADPVFQPPERPRAAVPKGQPPELPKEDKLLEPSKPGPPAKAQDPLGLDALD
ncbi:unnamed protein product [Durusdinium trenchii]|uniref:Peptidylamidoglycolate lyase n=2 Tax=Durusdinium trenchii TaxID=1381693 RepID=A0ABP0HKN3_9DINO